MLCHIKMMFLFVPYNIILTNIQTACLGRHLARIELRLMAARFFRNFPNATVSELEGMCDKDMEPALHFLMVPSGHRCLIQLDGEK